MSFNCDIHVNDIGSGYLICVKINPYRSYRWHEVSKVARNRNGTKSPTSNQNIELILIELILVDFFSNFRHLLASLVDLHCGRSVFISCVIFLLNNLRIFDTKLTLKSEMFKFR